MGNSNSTEDLVFAVFRKVGSVALAISYFTPAAVLTVPATIGAGVAGTAATIIGHVTDDDSAKEVGGWVLGLATDAAASGISGGSLDGTIASSSGITKNMLEGTKMVFEGYDKVSTIKSIEEEARNIRRDGKPSISSLPTLPPKETLNVIKHFF